MKVLALDQAPRHTGWAIGIADQHEQPRPVWGCLELPHYGTNDQRFMREFSKWFDGMLTEHKPDAIYFEQIIINPRGFDVNVTHAQMAVVACIGFVAMQHNIEAMQVLIGAWRKRFLGRANRPKWETENEWLKKAAMIECANRGWLTANEHSAEALGIMDYGLAHASADYRESTKADVLRRQFAARRKELER